MFIGQHSHVLPAISHVDAVFSPAVTVKLMPFKPHFLHSYQFHFYISDCICREGEVEWSPGFEGIRGLNCGHVLSSVMGN